VKVEFLLRFSLPTWAPAWKFTNHFAGSGYGDGFGF
jgi:hypothetical protein